MFLAGAREIRPEAGFAASRDLSGGVCEAFLIDPKMVSPAED
jgi:hypothetical protein